MRTTQLYIKVNNQWRELDLFDNVTIPITLKVSDIRQFGSKTSSFSLDFDLPHTNNNAQIFGLNSEMEIFESSFEVGRDYPAYLSNNSLTTFSGQFRLKKIIKKQNGKYIYYIGYLYGGAKNFVDELGTQTLTGNENPDDDLDFSEYDTPADEMTLTDFKDRLQNFNTGGYDWGLTLLDKTNKAATAFVGGAQTWHTDETTPYLHAIEIFNKIFSGTNYRYVSEFLQDSQYLQNPQWAQTIGKFNVYSLVYPYMKHNSNLRSPNPITSEVRQTAADSHTSAVTGGAVGGSNLYTYDLITHTFHFDNSYYQLIEQNVQSSLDNWSFTAPETGNYNINISFPAELRLYMKNVSDDTPLGDRTTIYTDLGDGTKQFTLWVQLEKNGQIIASGQRIFHYNENLNHSYYPLTTGWIKIIDDNFSLSQNNLFLAQGDTLTFYTYISLPLNYYDSTTYNYISVWSDNQAIPSRQYYYPAVVSLYLPTQSGNDTIIKIEKQGGFYEGAAFTPNSILNEKTTKIDYINNFIKMFNLYVEDVSGKRNYDTTAEIYPENTLRIEPYEIFYSPKMEAGQTNIKNWTDKIDWDTVEYRRIDDYLYNIQAFTKTQDGDYYNANYNQTYKLPYGNRNVKGVYCTQEQTNEIGLKISANLCGVVNNSTDVLQCPKVFSLDKSNNIDTKKEYTDGIFFLWSNDMSANTENPSNYTIKLQSRLSSTYNNITQYYCADTLNKGYGLDDGNLNWGGTNQYFQNMKGTIPTYNDLYSAFYKKQYEEYTAPDARTLRAKAYLTAFDIATVQLSDLIIVNGNSYHIGEINQWKNEFEPCEIELIKCIPTQATAPQTRNKFKTFAPIGTLPTTADNATLQNQITELQTEISELKK